MLQANIQGIHDAYFVIVGIGIVALLLSFFILCVSNKPLKLRKNLNQG
jgi:hypothetical protein